MQYDRRVRTRVAESSRIRLSDIGVSTMNTPILSSPARSPVSPVPIQREGTESDYPKSAGVTTTGPATISLLADTATLASCRKKGHANSACKDAGTAAEPEFPNESKYPRYTRGLVWEHAFKTSYICPPLLVLRAMSFGCPRAPVPATPFSLKPPFTKCGD